MNINRRELLQRSLRSLAESQVATMKLMDQTLSLFCDELALDPLAYFQRFAQPSNISTDEKGLLIDHSLLSIAFRGKVCFLGNTRPFWFLCHLAKRPNTYVTYEELLSNVWSGTVVSDGAVRTVAKNLRKTLREAGMAELADAIDGSEYGHYALKLISDW